MKVFCKAGNPIVKTLVCNIPFTIAEEDQLQSTFDGLKEVYCQPINSEAIRTALDIPANLYNFIVLVGHLENSTPIFTIEAFVDHNDGNGMMPFDQYDAELTQEEQYALTQNVLLNAMEKMDKQSERIEELLKLGADVAGMNEEQYDYSLMVAAYVAAGYQFN